MDYTETLTILGTQDTERRETKQITKNTTQHRKLKRQTPPKIAAVNIGAHEIPASYQTPAMLLI